ncbi:hypothetical protein IEQ34_003722 [Dendrobium chrysotoxum]|uniref:Ubiquitin-like protease family profile domain-containing protein n=1 Tax=Dendrobium chrysotoxum TaxID=161865 RepID=A0AAV7GY80_DENCH|nr:hypothetical protein IEQ34_003722 [Dendrobium chrysotoxum]
MAEIFYISSAYSVFNIRHSQFSEVPAKNSPLGFRHSLLLVPAQMDSPAKKKDGLLLVLLTIYVRPISYRCYVSTFRIIYDKFTEIIPPDVEDNLKRLNVSISSIFWIRAKRLTYLPTDNNINVEYFKAMSDTIFSSGNIIISRCGMDELLFDVYLNNVHLDAFAILLNEKSKLSSNKYHKFLYISPMYWSYKERVPKILYKNTKETFDSKITNWKFQTVKSVPTQINNVDCGMYICKYMKNIIFQSNTNWTDSKNW